MTQACEHCLHWLVAKQTTYDDGEVVTNFRSPEGKGQCQKLNIETEAGFGCNKFMEDGWDHTERHAKAGCAWQHWQIKACPDCKGYGLGCHRCAGTGKVRHYDDGFIGEEQTRLHPKQKAVMDIGPPKCVQCSRDLDVNWVSCPWCGARTNKPSPLEVIPWQEGAAQGTTDEMMSKMVAAKRDEAATEAVKHP